MALPARTPKGTKFRKFGDPKPRAATAVDNMPIRCPQLLQLTASHGGQCDLGNGHEGSHQKDGQAYPLFGADVSAPAAGETEADKPGIVTEDFIEGIDGESRTIKLTPLQEITAARIWFAATCERHQTMTSRWVQLAETQQDTVVGQLRLIVVYGKAADVDRRDAALAIAIARVVSGWRA